MITSPPAGLKKSVPMTRSKKVRNCEPAMNGVPNTTRAEVVAFAQTSSACARRSCSAPCMVKIDQEVDRGHDRAGAGELDAHLEEGLSGAALGGERR